MRINVRIGRLVLDGLAVTPAQAPQVRRAAEAELGRLLSTTDPRRLAGSGAAAPAAVAPGLKLEGGESPRVLGTRIARSVYAVLQPSARSEGR